MLEICIRSGEFAFDVEKIGHVVDGNWHEAGTRSGNRWRQKLVVWWLNPLRLHGGSFLVTLRQGCDLFIFRFSMKLIVVRHVVILA